nr:DUF3817 domain-containing protein [Paenibacillus arenosi]
MNYVLQSPIGRLRMIGIVEGISYILLLFVAMPLRTFMDMPEAVSISGMAHGILFLLYILAVGHVWLVHRWPLTRVIIAVLVSFIPFGNFVFDQSLKKEQNANPPKAA